MLSNLAPRVLNRDFAPGFMIRLQQKDLRLVLEAAEQMHLPLPATVIAQQMFRAVEAEGGGDLGTQAIVQSLEKLANCRIGEPHEDR
jgi:3-hydroxyisobutyrate dehydrogenase